MGWLIWKRDRHLRPEEVSEYLDGRLSARRVERIEAHLESCATCREEVDSLWRTVRLLRQLPQREPGRSFVFAAPPVPVAAPRPRVPSWAYGAAASVFALAFAIVLSVDLSGALVSPTPMGEQTAGGAETFEAPPRGVGEGTQTPGKLQEDAAPKSPEADQVPSFGAAPTLTPVPRVAAGDSGLGQSETTEFLATDEGTSWVWHLVEGILAAMGIGVGVAFLLRRRLTSISR